MKDHLASYFVHMTKFLAQAMGPQCEVVLHLKDKNGFYIRAIENSHVSGRSVNDPISKVVINMINSKEYLTKDYISNYRMTTKDGASLKSSTYFIKYENELIGLLCVNIDVSQLLDAASVILDFTGLTKQGLGLFNFDALNEKLEANDYLTENNLSIVDDILLAEEINVKNMKYDERIDFIEKIYKRGVFSIKGAVHKVATVLEVSEPTIYRYLQLVKNKNN